jgi:hypothetical protein
MQRKAGIFSLFENSGRLAGTLHSLEDPSAAWLVHCSGWYAPPQKIPLAENRQVNRHVNELKIQMKNPGNALHSRQGPEGKGVTRIMMVVSNGSKCYVSTHRPSSVMCASGCWFTLVKSAG